MVVAANVSTMDVYGRGRLSFTIFGVLFREFLVRVVERLENAMLIGLRFINSFGMSLNYFQERARLNIGGRK